jgi:peptide/nickel transport system substrate-binding protein
MKRKVLWIAISFLMVLSLVVASCGGAEETGGKVTQTGTGQTVTVGAEEEKEMGEEEEAVTVPSDKPQYGGTITLSTTMDYWGLLDLGHGLPNLLSHEHLWDGDWAKGPAGGYGTNECLWDDMTNIYDLKNGHLAESWEFFVDSEAETVTTIFQIRQGVYYAQVDSEAGRLVNGRELTADDVVWGLNQLNNNPDAMNFKFFPQIHGIMAEKTGDWEVSVTHPLAEHLGNIMRLVDNGLIFPPELYETYGIDALTDWKYSIGTGPYIITDSVPANMTTLVRNTNYWMNDPVGPGKGNQLPYIEKVKVAVIADQSTQQAALRTGNIDEMGGLNLEDKDMMIRQCPDLNWAARGGGNVQVAYMRVDQPPFDDINVRRAMMMAINLEEINEGLYAGLGTYPDWPYYYTPAYADLYMGLDDPICPDSVKELFTYNPEKAGTLLTNAGYPNGFSVVLTITQDTSTIDYYSIIKDYLDKVGITMEFRILSDVGAMMGVAQQRDYEMVVPGVSPPATYPEQFQYTGGSYINGSILNDSYVNEMADKARLAALTDQRGAMAITKELQPYLQDLALCLQTPRYPTYNLWWPWVKNYSGEVMIGYFLSPWVPYVWIDQDLKTSMGH